MKTQYERNLELALICMMCLFLLVLGCIIAGVSTCGELWIVCEKTTTQVQPGKQFTILSQNVKDGIRYFRFRNCESQETLQSSVSDNCKLEIR